MANVVSIYITPESLSQFWIQKRFVGVYPFEIVQFNTIVLLSETKSQFARDDPAFLVLLVFCLCGKFSKKMEIWNFT